MFGGLCWTVNGHLAIGGRTMGGVVLVAATDLSSAAALDGWVAPAVERARMKPPRT